MGFPVVSSFTGNATMTVVDQNVEEPPQVSTQDVTSVMPSSRALATLLKRATT
jgi:hypothetical protein